MITFEDFKKIELKIAKIIEVKEHPNADMLYVLRVEIEDKPRQIIAGIKKYYTPEELKGKQIVVLANIETATIRGEISEGMLLAAKDDENLAILIPEKNVKTGSTVS
ncbi:MAG: hypothetical protein KAU12_04840 [Candidatus Omnitrophica bacterium]|nr:hypothetical protein [Candidatus Omnitrophota bacterium]